jgi:hypothetical protein
MSEKDRMVEIRSKIVFLSVRTYSHFWLCDHLHIYTKPFYTNKFRIKFYFSEIIKNRNFMVSVAVRFQVSKILTVKLTINII